MTATAQQAQFFETSVDQVVANLGKAVVGKADVLRLVVTCLLTEGHMLLEDLPGTGKTTLARALAKTVAGEQQRIQFTPDLLPSDVTGSSEIDPQTGRFSFVPGPIFANVVLADEINRASPKTQSALLEVMEEGHVTFDRARHAVPEPFIVIATMNPVEMAGTYRLPEAQLDRFLMCTSIGYPGRADTISILAGSGDRSPIDRVETILEPQRVLDLADLASSAHIDDSVLGYVSDLADATRQHPHVRVGLSVRGAIGLVRAAKTWAMGSGRTYVTADDVKAMAPFVVLHRLVLHPEEEFAGASTESVLADAFAGVRPPTQRLGV